MKTYSFNKSKRLLKSEQFQLVLKNHKIKIKTSFFTIFVLENKSETSRLGLIVPKKQVRFASKRNRIKRVIREVFRLNVPFNNNYDIIFMAFNTILVLSNKEIVAKFLESLYEKGLKIEDCSRQ